MCVYVSANVYMCMYVCMYTHVHICMRVSIHMYTHVCTILFLLPFSFSPPNQNWPSGRENSPEELSQQPVFLTSRTVEEFLKQEFKK